MARPSILTALVVAALGVALFSVMDALMKGLAIAIGAYNAVLWRCLIGALFSGLVWLALRRRWPHGSVLRVHLLRSFVVTLMAVSFFWALVRLPLAEAIALSFFAPLITLYLAAVLLGEQVRTGAVIGSLLALAGVGVMLSPKLTGDGLGDLPAVGAVFFSAATYAYNLILARQQALVADPVEITFFQNLLVTGFLALAAPWLLVVPAAAQGGPLVMSALLAVGAVFLLAWAYARAQAQALVMVEYTAFIWAALLGWFWYSEPLTLTILAGTALIVAGCVIAVRQQQRAALSAPDKAQPVS